MYSQTALQICQFSKLDRIGMYLLQFLNKINSIKVEREKALCGTEPLLIVRTLEIGG